jgi:excisionase family DNA binding protein
MSKKDDFYTVAEASEVLGRSVPTIYRWLQTGKLDHMKNPVTGRYLVPKDAANKAAAYVKEWT